MSRVIQVRPNRHRLAANRLYIEFRMINVADFKWPVAMRRRFELQPPMKRFLRVGSARPLPFHFCSNPGRLRTAVLNAL